MPAHAPALDQTLRESLQPVEPGCGLPRVAHGENDLAACEFCWAIEASCPTVCGHDDDGELRDGSGLLEAQDHLDALRDAGLVQDPVGGLLDAERIDERERIDDAKLIVSMTSAPNDRDDGRAKNRASSWSSSERIASPRDESARRLPAP